MELRLRDYQQRMIDEARQLVASGKRRVLFFLPTGAGKGTQAVALMQSAFAKGHRAIFFAHRRELVIQIAERFRKYGIETTTLMAGYEFDPGASLVVASYQTFESRKDWLDKEYALVIFDEAHIGVERQFRVIKEFEEWGRNPVVIGFTATPMTNQGPGLGAVYDALIHGPTLDELIKQGYLVEPVFYAMQPLDWDPREHIKLNSAGEYDENAVFSWFKGEGIMGHVIENYKDHFMGKRFIVFARSVAQSVWIAEQFGKSGIPVAHIDYSTPAKVRRRIIEDFRNGDILGLSNVDIFSEGFDVPDMELVILATPMHSVVRYIQRVGRALRPAPGKERAIIVDHGGVLQEHGTIFRYQEWELEPPRPNRSRPAHAVKKPTKLKERTCPICNTVFPASRRTCPSCGYDFNRIPEAEVPEFIPAVMVEYREWLEDQRTGKRKRCNGVRLPIYMTPERFAAELLGWLEEQNEKRKSQGKPPLKRSFLHIIYYATICECPKAALFRQEPTKPGEWTLQKVKRFFVLRNKGYFNWDRFPCWR